MFKVVREEGRVRQGGMEETGEWVHKHIVVLNASGGDTVIKSSGGYPSSSFTVGVDSSRHANVIPSISGVSLAGGIILRSDRQTESVRESESAEVAAALV